MMENEDISPEEEALMMEAQLLQANTEYRRLSDDYINYKIQMHKKICHFNDAIKVLDGERLEFDMLLGRGRDPNLMKRSEKSKDILDGIVRQTKCTTTEILAELESLRRDNIMVDETEDELWKLRQEIGGPTVIFKRRIQQQRLIEKLKNRRQMMTARLGTAMMKNKFHRARIEDLRAMRLAFDQIFTRVRREIDYCKKKKFDLILKANHALEEKEEYQSVIKVLKEKNEKDQAQYEQTMRVMKRNKRGDEKICDFLGAKLNERLELKEEEEKKRINEITTALEADTKTLNVYKEAFECIQEVSEEKEVKEMVKNYSQKEAENFALFNYITDLNGQVEALQEELTSVRKEIKELAEEEVSLTRDHEETMRNLEVKYDILMDDINRCNEQLKDVNKVLDQLKSLIIHLFKKTGCRLRDVEILLGLNIRINSKNMIVYLGLIEQKANQMLNILHYITMQEDHRNGRMLSERPDISSFTLTDVPEVGNLMPTPQDREFQTAENIADASIEARILTKEELRNLGQVDILRRQRKKMAFLTDNKMMKKPPQLAEA